MVAGVRTIYTGCKRACHDHPEWEEICLIGLAMVCCKRSPG